MKMDLFWLVNTKKQGIRKKADIVLKESTYEGFEKNLKIIVHANDRDWTLISNTKAEYDEWIKALGNSDAKQKGKKKS